MMLAVAILGVIEIACWLGYLWPELRRIRRRRRTAMTIVELLQPTRHLRARSRRANGRGPITPSMTAESE